MGMINEHCWLKMRKQKIYDGLIVLESYASRKVLGLPALWTTIWSWLSAAVLEEACIIEEKAPKARKFPEIPILPDYNIEADNSFWSFFPKKDLPKVVTTPIRVNRLKNLIRRNGKNWNQQ